MEQEIILFESGNALRKFIDVIYISYFPQKCQQEMNKL